VGIVTADLSVSADGYAAGVNQSLDKPFGEGIDERLHEWMFEHEDDHRAEIDAITEADAYIMGRNMFSPGRGEWDLEWTGWWGPNPPYHAPVFVLTHHPRDSVAMEGGTTFTFVTEGIEAALDAARTAAGNGNVAIAGGPATINQYLAAGLIDELRLHIVPITVGAGERIFEGVGGLTLEPRSVRGTEHVLHVTYGASR
jgi:dihydrofolate reductase